MIGRKTNVCSKIYRERRKVGARLEEKRREQDRGEEEM